MPKKKEDTPAVLGPHGSALGRYAQKKTSEPPKNNPHGIKGSDKDPWLGTVEKDSKGTIRFDTIAHGVRAGMINLGTHLHEGNTTPYKMVVRHLGIGGDGEMVKEAGYKVAKGDTLAGIAKKFLGDKAKKEDIKSWIEGVVALNKLGYKGMTKDNISMVDTLAIPGGKGNKKDIAQFQNAANYITHVARELGVKPYEEVRWDNKEAFNKIFDAHSSFEKVDEEHGILPKSASYEDGKEEGFSLFKQHMAKRKNGFPDIIEGVEGGIRGMSEEERTKMGFGTTMPATAAGPSVSVMPYGLRPSTVPSQYEPLVLADFARQLPNRQHQIAQWIEAAHQDMSPEQRADFAKTFNDSLRELNYTEEHIIHDGDTLEEIGYKNRIAVPDLLKMNNLPEDTDPDAPLKASRGGTIIVDQPSLPGMFGLRDGLRDFIEGAAAYLNGWLETDEEGNKKVDWEKVREFLPEDTVLPWLKERAKDAYSVFGHKAMDSDESPRDPFLLGHAETLWEEDYDSIWHKGRISSKRIDGYRAILSGSMLSGSHLKMVDEVRDPEKMDESSEFGFPDTVDKAFDYLAMPGD